MGLALTRKVGSQSHFDFICLRAQFFPGDSHQYDCFVFRIVCGFILLIAIVGSIYFAVQDRKEKKAHKVQ